MLSLQGSRDCVCNCSCTPCAAGTFQTGDGMPYLINCTQCPANSYQPTVGARTSSACVMCPAGQSPAAANASSCSRAATSTNTATLYLAVGAVLGGALLAAAVSILVMIWLRKKKRSDDVGAEQRGFLGDADIVEAMLQGTQTKNRGKPMHTRKYYPHCN